MRGADGAGLAATQVGSLRRVFVYRLPDDADDAPARVVVNPKIVSTGEDTDVALEGCLSLGQAGVHVEVQRPTEIVIDAVDARGEPQRIEASGLHARILQHENDHLDGVLMLDRTPRNRSARPSARSTTVSATARRPPTPRSKSQGGPLIVRPPWLWSDRSDD